MPDWLLDSLTVPDAPTPMVALRRTLFAVACGFVVALIYRVAGPRQRPTGEDGLPTTLVLLCVLVGVVTLVIGGSVARAFGLVGALSVVRFRTAVADSRDTAFVIFAVSLGMAAGVGFYVLALFAVPAVALSALAMRLIDRPLVLAPRGTLTVKGGAAAAVAATLAPFADGVELSGVQTKSGGQTESSYRLTLKGRASAADIVAAVGGVAGVEAVEFKLQAAKSWG